MSYVNNETANIRAIAIDLAMDYLLLQRGAWPDLGSTDVTKKPCTR
jgi:hypothetical protein